MIEDFDFYDESDCFEGSVDNINPNDSSMFLDTSFTIEDHSQVDNFSSLLELDSDCITSADSFLHYYGGSLTLDDVNGSIQSASDFFNVDSPLIVSEGWTTGVYNHDLTTVKDDVLIFNPDQLQQMGITEKDGLDLVMTHENTHRVLQGLDTNFSNHQEELCCDYMSGVRAILNDISTDDIVNALKDTPETLLHPAGVTRVEAIQNGQDFAANYLFEHGYTPTFNECLEHFKTSSAFQQTQDPIKLVPNIGYNKEFHGYTLADVEWYEKQARISSGLEQMHWLKEAQWAKDHIHNFSSENYIEKLHEDTQQFYGGRYGKATGDYIDDSYMRNNQHEEFHGILVDEHVHYINEADSGEFANMKDVEDSLRSDNDILDELENPQDGKYNPTFGAVNKEYLERELRTANRNIDYYTKELGRAEITDTYRGNCKFKLEQAIKKAEDIARELKKTKLSNH